MSLEALAGELEASRPPRQEIDLRRVLFGPQLAFVADKAPFRTAVTSRRAGKSVGVSGALLDAADSSPDSVSLYITLTRLNAKRIIWRTLKAHAAEFQLAVKANESELSLTLPNGAMIYLAGAKDKTEIEKFRGLGLRRVVIDEAQSMPAHIEELIDDIIEPGLMDFNGDLTLTGTPSPVPVGYFYECTQNAEWAHHSWTVFENPHILLKSKRTPQQHLDRALKRRGVTLDDPKIQREFFGRWVYDPNSLVFKWTPAHAWAGELPMPEKGREYVIGVDLGFDDADAIAVIAFSADSPAAYLVEEHVMPKQTVSDLAGKLAEIIGRTDPLAVVMDTGGLGKKIAEEIRKRYSLPIKAAEKSRKFEYIELLNDALRTGRLRARASSKFAADAMLVEWDRDKSKGDKLVVSSRFHSDICDAVLYAYRESLHWLHEPKDPPPAEGTPEWEESEEAKLAERLQAEAENAERRWSA